MKEKISFNFTYSIFFILIALFPCFLVVGIMSKSFNVFSFQDNESWKKQTTPLHRETIENLCINLSMASSTLCRGNQDVYAPDFYPRIFELFTNESTTYQDVQLKLGRYQVELEPISNGSDGKPYFVAYYDLQGDGETWIAFFFKGTYESNSYMKAFQHFLNEGF